MRANEFITETNKQDKVRKGLQHSGIYAKRYDSMTDTFYPMYRFGIAMAGDAKTPSQGPVKAVPTVWMRNDEEAEIVAKAERTVGVKGSVIVSNGPSEEMPNVDTASPVAKVKRNKYGV
jgi:hypothetical protein